MVHRQSDHTGRIRLETDQLNGTIVTCHGEDTFGGFDSVLLQNLAELGLLHFIVGVR
jgi:hypothetical protein